MFGEKLKQMLFRRTRERSKLLVQLLLLYKVLLVKEKKGLNLRQTFSTRIYVHFLFVSQKKRPPFWSRPNFMFHQELLFKVFLGFF